MGLIRVMPDALAALVAAEEVVERPHNVAKELVENALDAGATRVTLELAQGGLRQLRCTDNGVGMGSNDAALAFERHATSKLYTAEDLRALRHFGFRGEALPSIARVADVTLETRRAADEAGTRVRIAFGAAPEVGPCARVPGTTVDVQHLFRTTPARLKFLGSPASEAARVLKVVREAALAHPTVAFTLTHDGTPLLEAPATAGGLGTRLAQLYGPDFLETLLPIAADGRGIRLAGYVSRPERAVGRTSRTHYLINGRPFQDAALRRVVTAAMKGHLGHGAYPEAVLVLAMDPAEFDANRSPDKSVIRFRQSGQVYATVTDAVRRAVTDPFRRAVAGAEFGVEFGVESSDAPMPRRGAAGDGAWAVRAVDPDFLLVPVDEGPTASGAPAPAGEPGIVADAPSLTPANAQLGLALPAPGGAVADRVALLGGAARLPAEPPAIWQVANTLLVVPLPEGVLYLDQHSAAERLNYERLVRAAKDPTGAGVQQPLLLPETIPLPHADAYLHLAELLPLLQGVGFDIEENGPRSFWVRATPGWVGQRAPARAIADAMAALSAPGARLLRESDAVLVRDKVLKTLACHTAIRAGEPLTEPAMRALWREVRQLDLGLADIHGRAGAVLVSHEEIARRLQRGGLPSR